MNAEELELGPMIGMMMAVMLLSIVPGMVGAKPPTYASVEGTVYDSGEQPPAPLGNATVYISGEGVFQEALTDHNGKFYFSEVPLGQYTLTAVKTGYEVGSVSVSLTESKLYSENIFLLPDTVVPDLAHLSGTVHQSKDPYLPIHGAMVRLETNSSLVDKTPTNPDGSYGFTDVDPGWYTIRIVADQYHEWTTFRELKAGLNTQNAYLDQIGIPTAQFDAIGLDVDKTEVFVGQSVNVGVTVKNVGDATGTCVVSTDPGDDPHFTLGITPGTWSPAVVPMVYVPAIDVTPIISVMMVMMMMSMVMKMMK